MAAVMTGESAKVQRTYLTLILFTTLSASLIWGINTLFLLDAGLNNLEAFAANAFFTAGMMLFEVPTGVVADLRGRRLSFLLGSATLTLSTLAYVLMWQLEAPFWAWAVVSVVIGLGFTFFSGAVEAWLVDALRFTGYDGPLDPVFAKAQAVAGGAMLSGSVLGGIIAQFTSLGVPFVVRSALLGVTFVLALLLMHDLGFTPVRGERPVPEMKRILNDSLHYGLGRPAVRWVMLTAPFIGGVGHLRVLRDAALPARALRRRGGVRDRRPGGGDRGRRADRRRAVGAAAAAAVPPAYVADAGLCRDQRRARCCSSAWSHRSGSSSASWWSGAWPSRSTAPVRQAYLNDLIPSQQRATVLSFDSLLGSAGGVVVQPAFGRVADVNGYALTFGLSAAVQACAIPFLVLARRTGVAADIVTDGVAAPVQEDRA